MTLSRRAALLGAGALALSPTLPARAAAPLAGRQAPGFRRLRVGRYEVTALLDGHLGLEAGMFSDLGDPAPLLERAFRPAGPLVAPVNAYAVNDGERLVLIDAGTNEGFDPGLGHLGAAMEAAGLSPGAVDAVVVTHLHPDHVGGAERGGRAVFPNAELVVPEAEAAFWLSDEAMARAPAEARPFFEVARGAVSAYGSRVRRLAAGASPGRGLEAVPLPGHTPGHAGYLLSDGGESLLFWGDIVHGAAFQFPRPGASIGFDADPRQAVETRRRAFDRAASERLRVAGVHLPFPGWGHVAREGEGYAFVPTPYLPL